MRSIFVTGASGYVGRRFLRAAASAGFPRVAVLDREADPLPAELRALPGVEAVPGDLLRPESYAAALPGGGHVLHLAATTGKSRRAVHFRTNVDGTRALLGAARAAGVAGFLHVSTIAARFADQRSYPYGQSKTAGEAAVRESGVPFTIVRPTIVLGPGAPVLEGLARMAGLPLVPVFGSGATALQPVWVDDLAACLVELLAAERFRGETIELGGPDVVSAEDLLRRIREATGRGRARVVHVPIGPVRAVLALLEPALLPVLPLTAGQLATFANDGTAAPGEFTSAWGRRLTGLDEALRGALARG